MKIFAPNKLESADREQKHELKDFELAVIAVARQIKHRGCASFKMDLHLLPFSTS